MSLRPPSLVNSYDDFWSEDPAIIPMPPEDDKEGRAERERLIRVARETGDLKPITVEGQVPCKFVMKPLKGNVYRELIDAVMSGKIGGGKMNQIAFRAAINRIVDPSVTIEIERADTERYGSIAKVEITDELDRINVRIVSELGAEAIRRAADLSPK